MDEELTRGKGEGATVPVLLTVPEDEVEEGQQLINSQPAKDNSKNRSYKNFGKPFQSNANPYKRYLSKKKKFIQKIQNHAVCSTLLKVETASTEAKEKKNCTLNIELRHPYHS